MDTVEAVLRSKLCTRSHPGMVAYDCNGPVPVCHICGLPSAEAELGGNGRVSAIFFRGGPLDGSAYDTRQLLQTQDPGAVRAIGEYRYSPETITSDKSGITARVWLHRSVPDGAQDLGPESDTQERSSQMTDPTQAPPAPPVFPGGGPGEDDNPTFGSTGVSGDPQTIADAQAPPVESAQAGSPETPSPDAMNDAQAVSEAVAQGETSSDKVVPDSPAEQAPASQPAADYPQVDGKPAADFGGSLRALEDVRAENKISRNALLSKVHELEGHTEFEFKVLWRTLSGGGARTPTNAAEVNRVIPALQALVQEKATKRAGKPRTDDAAPASTSADPQVAGEAAATESSQDQGLPVPPVPQESAPLG